MQYDLLRIKKSYMKNKLVRNKIITSISFIFLMTSIFFINKQQNSVWYYFSAGFFLCRMLGEICNKAGIKYALTEIDCVINKLKDEMIK